MAFHVRRLATNPIIYAGLSDSIGVNINGPSLIRVPNWVADRLGRYYLYFAHHQGQYIRLAYADHLAGPWHIHEPGTLRLEETPCRGHIASPDVHVDDERQRIVMYYHGPVLEQAAAVQDPLTRRFPFLGGQRTFAAVSDDGLAFVSGQEILGPSYFRVFQHENWHYALGMPGVFFRSRDGLTGFEQGPTLFGEHMRHAGLRRQGESLYVFYSVAGDCPEHIVVATIDLGPDWMAWQATDPVPVIRPERAYEGANLPLVPSTRGSAQGPVRQLRDPYIYEEASHTYLFYSVAGESGIAIAELFEDDWLIE